MPTWLRGCCFSVPQLLHLLVQLALAVLGGNPPGGSWHPQTGPSCSDIGWLWRELSPYTSPVSSLQSSKSSRSSRGETRRARQLPPPSLHPTTVLHFYQDRTTQPPRSREDSACLRTPKRNHHPIPEKAKTLWGTEEHLKRYQL